LEGVNCSHEVGLSGQCHSHFHLLLLQIQLQLHLPHHKLRKVRQHGVLSGLKMAGLDVKNAQSA
jgi:hypothetical protein